MRLIRLIIQETAQKDEHSSLTFEASNNFGIAAKTSMFTAWTIKRGRRQQSSRVGKPQKNNLPQQAIIGTLIFERHCQCDCLSRNHILIGRHSRAVPNVQQSACAYDRFCNRKAKSSLMLVSELRKGIALTKVMAIHLSNAYRLRLSLN